MENGCKLKLGFLFSGSEGEYWPARIALKPSTGSTNDGSLLHSLVLVSFLTVVPTPQRHDVHRPCPVVDSRLIRNQQSHSQQKEERAVKQCHRHLSLPPPTVDCGSTSRHSEPAYPHPPGTRPRRMPQRPIKPIRIPLPLSIRTRRLFLPTAPPKSHGGPRTPQNPAHCNTNRLSALGTRLSAISKTV